MKKILILASNPRKDLNLDREIRDLRDVVESSRNREEFDVEDALAVRVGDLQNLLFEHQPYIVHFCGHGGGRLGLVLESNDGGEHWVQAKALRGLFRLFSKQVKCVVLNACYSEEQADEIVNHIDYVIGMDQEIRDDAAIAFSKGFYRALGYGCSIEDAYEFGCNAIQLEISDSSNVRSAIAEPSRRAEVVRAVTHTVIPEYLKPVLRKRQGLVTSDVPGENPSSLSQAKKEEFQWTLAQELTQLPSPSERISDQQRSSSVPQALFNPVTPSRQRNRLLWLTIPSVAVGIFASLGLYEALKPSPNPPVSSTPLDQPVSRNDNPEKPEQPPVDPELTPLQQAKDFAKNEHWYAAIEMLNKISIDSTDAPQRDILLAKYAYPLLESAYKQYDAGNLNKALIEAQAVPKIAPNYDDAQDAIALWEQDKAAIAEVDKIMNVNDIVTVFEWDRIKNPVLREKKQAAYEIMKRKVAGEKPLPQETWETSEYAWLSVESLTEESLKAKLNDLSGDPLKVKLSLLRNSLYAKYHYRFTKLNLKEVFQKYSWYQPNDITDTDCLESFSPIEKANHDLIASFEKKN
jgi:YARHG domain